MSRDQIFRNNHPHSSDFEFTEAVASVFDDMLVRSIPFYLEQQKMIRDIAEKFWVPDTKIIDFGCSLGTTLIQLANALPNVETLIGLDNSEPMLARARQQANGANLSDRIHFLYADLNDTMQSSVIKNTSVLTLCWTLQFVRPLKRESLIKTIYENLSDGGAMIVTDKVLTNDSNMNRFFIDFYYDFKRKNEYSEEEISKKRESLENVLIPYRFDENVELFRRNGFEIVETFFQWFNFAGFLCVKNPA